MISFESKGSFDRTERFVRRLTTNQIFQSLSQYGEIGKSALAQATPRDTGLAASSWSYRVEHNGRGWEIVWTNDDRENGFPVVISLQYGHGTGTGGYVQGRDFINPVIKPLFDQIAEAVWREVTRG